MFNSSSHFGIIFLHFFLKCYLLFLFLPLNAQIDKLHYPVSPVPFTKVNITDSFWKERIRVNREVTIPIALKRSEETGRIKNFKVAAGIEKGSHNTSRGYDDSDVYKVMEGAAYSLSQYFDPELKLSLDSLVNILGMAQEEDGYLYTVKTILGVTDKHRDARSGRWEDVEHDSHELYNAGHMYEAAVAHYYSTGRRDFLEIAIKNANLIYSEFGWGKREAVPGHQEVEIGLVKLFGATGDQRYLELAKFFLDKRGENERRSTYNQSHKKVTEQDKAVGHSVRAAYMYTAMADMAALTKDKAYLDAMDKLWHDIVDTKLYIIGGIGAAGGYEGFGDHFELPNLKAYNETCAAIANVFWNYRLFLTHGDAKYMDVLERSLYNNVLSGVSLDGEKFFYPNRLESRGQEVRSEWFETSCCPSNVSRFLPDVPGYIYAQNDSDIYVNLFISSVTDFILDGQKIALEQISQIPWSGNVEFKINAELPREFSLRLRIPGWASEKPVPSDLYAFKEPLENKTEIWVNGEKVPYEIEKGYAVIQRNWSTSDEVEVKFPYEVRTIVSHPNIKENHGKVALQAGPLVYCVEGQDLPNGQANNIMIDPDQDLVLSFEKDLLGGVMTVQGSASFLKKGSLNNIVKETIPFKAIPYYAWANRGGSEMQVWIPVTEAAAFPHPLPSKTKNAKLDTSKENRITSLYSVNDGYTPEVPETVEVPHFNFWPLNNSKEWITMTFDEPVIVSKSKVYWVETDDGGVGLPKQWQLYYDKNGNWQPIRIKKYPIADDGSPSDVTFNKVTTKALKLEVKQDKKPTGLYEWEIE